MARSGNIVIAAGLEECIGHVELPSKVLNVEWGVTCWKVWIGETARQHRWGEPAVEDVYLSLREIRGIQQILSAIVANGQSLVDRPGSAAIHFQNGMRWVRAGTPTGNSPVLCGEKEPRWTSRNDLKASAGVKNSASGNGRRCSAWHRRDRYDQRKRLSVATVNSRHAAAVIRDPERTRCGQRDPPRIDQVRIQLDGSAWKIRDKVSFDEIRSQIHLASRKQECCEDHFSKK